MGELTQEQLAEIAFGIYDYVDNPKNPHVLDRTQLVWHSMLQKMKAEKPFVNNKITIKYKSEATELDMQIWNNRDRLAFQEWREGFDLEFNGVQVHVGLEIPHQELKDNGYIIVPNGPRSMNFAAKMSKVESLRLIDTLKEKFESAMDRWDILIDQKFLHNVSGNPDEPVALTDLVSKTPTVGLFGGRTRSDPQMQNGYTETPLASAADDLERDLRALLRQAALYNRGFKGTGVKAWMASAGWIDRYTRTAKDTGYFRYMADLSGISKVDLGIPDSAIVFDGVAIVHNPTMDLMAQLTGDASWDRRAYGINPDTFVWAHAPKEDKFFSAPPDAYDQRISRFSLDGRYSLYCINPRSNVVHEFDS